MSRVEIKSLYFLFYTFVSSLLIVNRSKRGYWFNFISISMYDTEVYTKFYLFNCPNQKKRTYEMELNDLKRRLVGDTFCFSLLLRCVLSSLLSLSE